MTLAANKGTSKCLLWSIIYDLARKVWVGGEGPFLKGLNRRDEELKKEQKGKEEIIS